jgi:hypothetical protein
MYECNETIAVSFKNCPNNILHMNAFIRPAIMSLHSTNNDCNISFPFVPMVSI